MTAELYGPAFFAGRSPSVIQSADLVVPHVMRLLKPRSVLDLGCGQGEWMFTFPLVDVVGVDISDQGIGIVHDLTEPLDLGRTFDLVVCLETGEHLPAEAADTLVDTIVRHVASPAGAIVFGAAVVGQEGVGHINCQPHEYWHAKFEACGFTTHDSIRPLIQNEQRISPWYRNNIFVYQWVF